MRPSFCRLAPTAKYASVLFLLIAVATNFSTAAPTFGSAVTNGIVDIPDLVEASGIAASRNNANVIWTENDSGNPAVVYAIDTQGHLLGTYELPGNNDNEDLGIGPGPVPNVSYLYVTDIGDNAVTRPHIEIYQAPEPAVYAVPQAANPFTNAPIKGMRTITLSYPDGPHNAEAEFTDSVTGDWFVLTKEFPSRIYTASKSLLDTQTNITLTFVETLNFDVPNGADISPLGDEILVRQENFAGLWARTNGQSISNAFKFPSNGIPVVGITNGEPNGEAIGFDYFGGGYFTLSDSEPTGIQPLNYFPRISADGPTPPRVLVPMAANWKYLANGSNRGTAWQNPAFDDSSWSSGQAQFGFGNSNAQTIVSFGPAPNNKFITTYFRNHFIVTNANRIAVMTLKLVVDDGALVYINGSPVTNLNLNFGVAFNTLSAPMPFALRDTWQSFFVEPRLLREGTNTLAVEVHLASAIATNMAFDLQLISTEAPFITSVLTSSNHQAQIFVAGSSNSPTTLQASTNLTIWTNIGSQILTNSKGAFQDSQATNFNVRFYRAFRAVP